MNEEDVERYSLGDLSGELCESFEEHLLICESCRGRVSGSDSFLRSMQTAAAELRDRESGQQRRSWAPRWAMALAAAAVLAAVAVFGLYGTAKPEFAVNLVAMRGGEQMAKAPARTTLLLKPDVATLNAAPPYRIEVVDSVGEAVWSGPLAEAKLPPRRAGNYFVRIYSGGQLLREYGLQIQ